MINNEEFLKVLELLKPALSPKGIIPIFGDYCFDKNTISTYNDELGVSVKFISNIEGGVKGDVLYSWVKSCTKPIDYEASNTEIKFKSGRSKLELPLTNKSDFVHKVPTPTGQKVIFDSTLVECLQKALTSVSGVSSLPAMAGVTLNADKEGYYFYSTNGVSITNIFITNNAPDEPINGILNKDFCKVIIKTLSVLGTPLVALYFSDDTIYADFGDVLIWSNAVNYEEYKLDFLSEIDKVLEPDFENVQINISDDLISSLKKIVDICGEELTTKPCKFTLVGDELKIDFSGTIKINEVVLVPENTCSDEFILDVKPLLEGLTLGNKFALLSNAVVVTGTNSLYLQANRNG
jgi:DNA polymerase III sliding clamp (beta) subunit (PCNA family)